MHPKRAKLLYDWWAGSDSPAPSPIEKKIGISFGTASKAFAGTNWNFAHVASTSGYSLNNLVNLDGEIVTGLNLVVTSAFSVQASGGSNQAVSGDADFPATIAREYWYPASGSRVITFQVPGGGLGVALGKIKTLHNITIGTPPHIPDYTILGVQKTLTNAAGDPPVAGTPPAGNVLEWTGLNFSSNFTVTGTDNTGIAPLNAMILTYYVNP